MNGVCARIGLTPNWCVLSKLLPTQNKSHLFSTHNISTNHVKQQQKNS